MTDLPHPALTREEYVFQQMHEFHLQRVDAVVRGDVPLDERDGGILILHLIPESRVLGRTLLEGTVLKEHGSRIRPLGERGGSSRFNVDGFLNCDGYDKVRAYSQFFRDGRLESVMSDVGYPVNHHVENPPMAIRAGLCERSVFEVVHDYANVCKAIEVEPPIWLFSTLVECKGFQMVTDRSFRSLSGNAIDRTPAILPELKITSFDAEPQRFLKPWCDSLWQATGIERSFNYDVSGNWQEPS